MVSWDTSQLPRPLLKLYTKRLSLAQAEEKGGRGGQYAQDNGLSMCLCDQLWPFQCRPRREVQEWNRKGLSVKESSVSPCWLAAVYM